MQEALRLIEVDRLSYIGRDLSIMLIRLLDAIDLNCQQHGDTEFVQFPGECDGFRCSPAMSKDDDTGSVSYVSAQVAVPLFIQNLKDFTWGHIHVSILKGCSN